MIYQKHLVIPDGNIRGLVCLYYGTDLPCNALVAAQVITERNNRLTLT